jgi:nitroreductase
MKSFLELAKERYSVKGFSDKAVEEDKLAKILEAGNVAPTAKNNQPQRIYVLKSEEALKKARELTSNREPAPGEHTHGSFTKRAFYPTRTL